MISSSPSCSLLSSVFSPSAGVGKAVTVTLTPCHCSRKAVCGVSSCPPQSGGGGGDRTAPHSPPGLGAGRCLLHGSSWRSPPQKSLGSHSGKPPSPSGFLPCVPASQNAPVGSSGALWCSVIRLVLPFRIDRTTENIARCYTRGI